MKHLKTIVSILLNIVFCAVLLWFFTRNAFLRPYAGSPLKEIIAGLLLLGSLYANYFLFYPKLYQYSNSVYWLLLVFTALMTAFLDFAIAYPNISLCCAETIQHSGFFSFFSKRFLFVVGRNLAFNFFPFLFRERQHFKKSLEKEVKVVYQTVRMLDVTDKDNNIQLVNIDDIFYCHQQRNFTDIYTLQNIKYMRLGSMKHLEQLFGDDFVRITPTVLVPFRYIKKCTGDTVIMQKRPWEEAPTTFTLDPKDQKEIADKVEEGIVRNGAVLGSKQPQRKPSRPKNKRKRPITPSDDKIKAVLSCIEKNPNCNSGDIIAETQYSLSTVGRCLYELKKQGLIKHTGSRKTGGYKVVNNPPEENVEEAERGEE